MSEVNDSITIGTHPVGGMVNHGDKVWPIYRMAEFESPNKEAPKGHYLPKKSVEKTFLNALGIAGKVPTKKNTNFNISCTKFIRTDYE
ncbi:hypothetical protein ACTXT7_000102 [Hymenolepis weldensis]